MRFLTRAAVGLLASERRYQLANETYAAQLSECQGEMSRELSALAHTTSFHDGLVVSIQSDKADLLMMCVLGDLQVGYHKLSIRYRDAHILDEGACARILRDRRSEILADEFCRVSTEAWEHNLLFSPRGEISIRFRTLDYATEPLPFRYIDYFGDPYRLDGA
ncbi:hypothetical protein [Maricaulis sp.]|uniref:hypothetical protein n=1 Tax=Maricaulis sp. TaxID=1486257 RepID=UPI003A8D5B43